MVFPKVFIEIKQVDIGINLLLIVLRIPQIVKIKKDVEVLALTGVLDFVGTEDASRGGHLGDRVVELERALDVALEVKNLIEPGERRGRLWKRQSRNQYPPSPRD